MDFSERIFEDLDYGCDNIRLFTTRLSWSKEFTLMTYRDTYFRPIPFYPLREVVIKKIKVGLTWKMQWSFLPYCVIYSRVKKKRHLILSLIETDCFIDVC